jgi:RimJ/RimL family protein N-acetyltransferase
VKPPVVPVPERLEGRRIYLRPLADTDTDLILRWRADPLVARQLFSERPPTRAEHEAWLRNLRTAGNRMEFVIVNKDGGLPCGTIGLAEITAVRAEYGVMIGEPEWRGRGIAFEASELLLDFAFNVLKLGQVMLRLFSDNAEAKRLYGRVGFVEDPSAGQERLKDGDRRSTSVMRLRRLEWQKRRTKDARTA